MTILDDTIKPNLEKLDQNIAPYYTNLEPWQRGLLLIALTAFLLFAIYQLTKSEKPVKQDPKREKEIEERLMRQMAFFKRLRE